jgi:adenine-specific DNA-methyltransferase
MNKSATPPLKTELPSSYAERVGREYIATHSPEHKKTYAQYFTPHAVATFMATLSNSKNDQVTIADLGSGTGILGISVCEHLAQNDHAAQQLTLTVFEIDKDILPYLECCLIYTKSWLAERGIAFEYHIESGDFVLEHAVLLNQKPTLFGVKKQRTAFDIIITNPPYFKINKADPRAKAAAYVIHGQPNIYALFMAIASHMLRKDGELICITPRSFTAGPYFRLFREHFFTYVAPAFLHIFDSRNKAFAKDNVLQENIILKAINKSSPAAMNDSTVTLSFSNGLADLQQAQTRSVLRKDILDMNTKSKVIKIPVTRKEERVVELVQSWTGSLPAFGMNISTGPVVPFRARDVIIENGKHTDSHIPLLWMQNIKSMEVTWPLPTKKQQYMQSTAASQKLFVKNANYVLLRRFSAKEEKQRLVVAPYLATSIPADMIALENHLNYIYRPEGELSEEEVFGLAALYNCSLLETYFRTCNGNTQVSATEIKEMPLPALSIIRQIGRRILEDALRGKDIDAMVADVVLSSRKVQYA